MGHEFIGLQHARFDVLPGKRVVLTRDDAAHSNRAVLIRGDRLEQIGAARGRSGSDRDDRSRHRFAFGVVYRAAQFRRGRVQDQRQARAARHVDALFEDVVVAEPGAGQVRIGRQIADDRVVASRRDILQRARSILIELHRADRRKRQAVGPEGHANACADAAARVLRVAGRSVVGREPGRHGNVDADAQSDAEIVDVAADVERREGHLLILRIRGHREHRVRAGGHVPELKRAAVGLH